MNILKIYKTFLLLIFCSIIACASDAKECSDFKGAWFDVCVPNNFSVDKSGLCALNESECDSAKFYSKSRDSYLYIYSPQWSGNIDEYKNEISAKSDEKLILNKKLNKDYYSSDGKKVAENAIIEKEIEVKKEGIYKRKYHINVNQITNSVLVVGLMWPDGLSKEDNDKYLSVFNEFKKSIKQYSD